MILLLFFFSAIFHMFRHPWEVQSQGVAPMLGAGVCVSGGPRPEAPFFYADIMESNLGIAMGRWASVCWVTQRLMESAEILHLGYSPVRNMASWKGFMASSMVFLASSMASSEISQPCLIVNKLHYQMDFLIIQEDNYHNSKLSSNHT